jgi:hypothetical protein
MDGSFTDRGLDVIPLHVVGEYLIDYRVNRDQC